jgi:hypothetical protein
MAFTSTKWSDILKCSMCGVMGPRKVLPVWKPEAEALCVMCYGVVAGVDHDGEVLVEKTKSQHQLAAESLDVCNHKSGNSHDISKKAKTIAKKPAKNVPVECATPARRGERSQDRWKTPHGIKRCNSQQCMFII